MAKLTDKGFALMLEHEGCPEYPYWPGNDASGVTIGLGFDLGHTGKEEFYKSWGPYLGMVGLNILEQTLGAKGERARILLEGVKHVFIPRETSMRVFNEVSVPVWFERMYKAFPGAEELPADAQSALVSLVYNRGVSMGKPTDPGYPTEDRRKEMRDVRDAVAIGDLAAIADAVLDMKRLWEDKGLDGLLRRRDDEAALIMETLDG